MKLTFKVMLAISSRIVRFGSTNILEVKLGYLAPTTMSPLSNTQQHHTDWAGSLIVWVHSPCFQILRDLSSPVVTKSENKKIIKLWSRFLAYCDIWCHSETGYLKITAVKEPFHNLVHLSITSREQKVNYCSLVFSKNPKCMNCRLSSQWMKLFPRQRKTPSSLKGLNNSVIIIVSSCTIFAQVHICFKLSFGRQACFIRKHT